jgi:hypothetical protein
MAYITGEIRDQGSNFSHETRFARLLATLLLLGNFWDSSIRFRDKKQYFDKKKQYIMCSSSFYQKYNRL